MLLRREMSFLSAIADAIVMILMRLCRKMPTALTAELHERSIAALFTVCDGGDCEYSRRVLSEASMKESANKPVAGVCRWSVDKRWAAETLGCGCTLAIKPFPVIASVPVVRSESSSHECYSPVSIPASDHSFRRSATSAFAVDSSTL